MRWSYKTVHYELQKEGLLGNAFLDESEIEKSLNEYGKAGWELVTVLETMDGLIAILKQPLSYEKEVYASAPRKAAAAESVIAEDENENRAVIHEFRAAAGESRQADYSVEDPEKSEDHNDDEFTDVGSIRIE
jgi:hypothetical protein